MNPQDRMEELQEKRQEFIINEMIITPDESPSWGEIAEASAEAESLWDATDEGKELKALEELLRDDEQDDYGHAEQKNFD